MSKIGLSRIRVLATSAAVLLAAGCGGGGGGGLAGVGSGGTGTVAGFAIKGPIASGTVTAYGISDGQKGAQIGSAMTAADGSFSMGIGGYAGAIMLQVSGGTYTDEATGSIMPMATGDVMTAIMPAVAAGTDTTGIQVTPLTAMAQAMAQSMSGGMIDANIAAANAALGSKYAISDILHVRPMDPLTAGSGSSASQDAQNYGMTLAAMSKYAQTAGMSSSSAIVTAMMNDAADGVLDGKAGTAPVMMGGTTQAMPAGAATTGIAAAMASFMASSQNQSGIGMVSAMTQLSGADGTLATGMTGMTSAP